MRGTSPQAFATARLVPSPPNVTMQLTFSATMCADACVESSQELVTGMGTIVESKPKSRASRAFFPMQYESGIIKTRLIPVASKPNSSRRTILTFSLLLNTVPCATSRRMSGYEC